ncbi:serine/threonine-protein kinase [Mycobacterium sp. URHD0025]|uniref:serine/threonine-protein kinase n=1 Tax=Mycobacterium sp. URHD0025 TaxID=1298864 RepID=UPI00041CCE9B|nr:serine/threonine-protein kinase [Mycobacterium sp. URHD0025]
MEFKPGDVVGGYAIQGVLGRGGMGIVYRAANPTLPRSDALKVLSSEYSNDPQFRARFEREATVASTLGHPNIVAVYSRGETEGGQLWIAMQYVAGTDADRELLDGRMTPDRAAHVIGEVAKALDYAHRRRVLHRDVKPANFLIAPAEHEGDDERVFLADFGIARAKDDTTHLTTDGTVMASIAYAAPEALSGTSDQLDHRADIYSLGCSLFRLLTGKTPFAGRGGVPAIVTAHVFEDPPKVTDLAPHLPIGLNDVIAKAMAKNPDARYQTARELAEATTAAIADTTTAVPKSTVTQAWDAAPPADGVTHPAGRPPHWRPGGPQPTTGIRPGPHSAPAPTYPSGQFSATHAPTQPREFTGAPAGPRSPVPMPPPEKKSLKRRIAIPAAAVALVAVLAIAGFVLLYRNNPNNAPYTPQTITHAHGTTEITASPRAVAALGPGDADALLALGLQPVAIASVGGTVPSWIQDKLTGDPALMNFIDTSAIGAAKPDLILATGDIDDATYERLAAIAPTVTRPTGDDQPWNWQSQLKWVAKIVGKEGVATQLTSTIAAQQNDLRNQNSKAAGKTVSVLNMTDEGLSWTLTPSNAADFLTTIGLAYDQKLARGEGETAVTRAVGNLYTLYTIDSSVLVVIRTDKAAGGGGAAGLPSELSAFRGALVIVDDPDTIAALENPGGVLATQFLDKTWVPQLVDQVHA